MRNHILIAFILTFSILMEGAAALLAFRLIGITGRRAARLPFLRASLWVLLVLPPHRCQALNPDLDVLQYNCETWRRQNGLPVNGITAIAQAKDGFLWFGTSAGLVRFDGIEFKLIDFGAVKQLPSSDVTSLGASRSGGVWVGLNNGAFGYFDGKKFSFLGKKEYGGEHLNVRTIRETADGTLCIVSQDRLARLKTNGTYEEFLISTIGGGDFFDGFEDSQGRFWGAAGSRGIFYWQAGETQPVQWTPPSGEEAYAIAGGEGRQLWVGMVSRLCCLDTHLEAKESFPMVQNIRTLLVDRHGVLWIGTTGHGLFRYYNGKCSSLRKVDGLASDYVQALAEDHEGNLWVGTRSGLSQLTDLKFPTYGAEENLERKEALTVGASRKGGVWIGTPLGLTYFDGSYTTYTTNCGLADPYVKRVFEASNGDVYLVAGLQTLTVLSHGRVVTNYSAPGMVVGLCEDAQGVVVSVSGDLYRAGTNYFRPYDFADSKPNMGWILNLMTGHDGSIWVASVFGIFRVKDAKWQQWACNVPEMPSTPLWICEDSDGVIWASLLSGITRLKDNQLTWINRQQGLFDDNISTLIPDDQGGMWMDSVRGIFRVSRKNLNDVADGKAGRVEYAVYDGPECVKTTDKSAIQEHVACKTVDGRIWFPGPLGAVAVDPAHIPTNPVAPQVHIDSVVANGKEVDKSGSIVVPPGDGELEFRFTGLSFIASQKMKFRYQLVGYDKDWVETQARRIAFYTNLKPGRYQFRVIAANADGVWNNQGASLELELRPHFDQTVWFFGLCVGAGLVGLAGLYGWRVRHLHQKERALLKARDQLEAEVRSRTAELAGANSSLREEVEEHKRTADQLSQKTVSLEREILEREKTEEQLRQAQKLEAVGQLAAGIAHEINTPTQYVGDNTRFLKDAFDDITSLLRSHGEVLAAAKANSLTPEILEHAEDVLMASDLEYLFTQIPQAIQETLEGVERVTKIVRAMKDFSHPGGKEKTAADLNKAIESTTTVARSEWKYVADLKLDLAPDLPLVPCFLGEFNQAILNLVVNAAHTIGDVVKLNPDTKGLITIRTRREDDQVEIRVSDTGTGIPEHCRSHIFEPFFTTKEVGKGTGQGLALVYNTIVKKHGGTVTFETETGKGTAFAIRLPVNSKNPALPGVKSSEPPAANPTARTVSTV